MSIKRQTSSVRHVECQRFEKPWGLVLQLVIGVSSLQVNL